MPKTYTKYTARKVLTTQWIDGEKLSQSTESDVGELVNVGVICYLKQVIFVLTVHSLPSHASRNGQKLCYILHLLAISIDVQL